MPEIRKWVDELMIYDADDQSCTEEAKETLSSEGSARLGIEGIRNARDLSAALQRYCNVRQVTFTTHGFPGGVYFKGGSLSTMNLGTLAVPLNLFRGEGRLLFMG